MLVNGIHYESIEYISENDRGYIKILDQRKLPFEIEFLELDSMSEVNVAIKDMAVRGAPLIGLVAAYGLLFSLRECTESGYKDELKEYAAEIISQRPTAVNAAYCVNKTLERMLSTSKFEDLWEQALLEIKELTTAELMISQKIGAYGLEILKELSAKKQRKLNILTHCNAGWLACVDLGTALAPIYLAKEAGIDIHVWVDETRPRNQGARLTAWELSENNIPNTVITDNAGGYLMQQGLVDVVIVGCDRAAINGDAANKIGTYLKALAAYDNQIPFYVALPSTTIDWNLSEGVKSIEIETRDVSEVKYIEGWENGQIKKVLLTPEASEAYNPGFDVTPAKYITGLITERGVCEANEEGIKSLFLERFEEE